ncbi:MAG: hypothetical protein EON60_09985 [Alphaproteobacteria bacterium]|nr:MAG: hypothetical protein EON60_09985 [Alphaproteobacteria bacterium]
MKALHEACPQMERRRHASRFIKSPEGQDVLIIGWYCYAKEKPEDRPPPNLLELEEVWMNEPLPDNMPDALDFNGKTILLKHEKYALAYMQ